MSEHLRAVIVDDEGLARAMVKKYLNEYPEIDLVAECSNGFEGIKTIQKHEPDLVFLDIQMPKLTGFELLEILDDPPVIIFTTAYDQFALKAFEVNAADYLMKPFSKDRFDEAIKKAMIRIKENKELDKTEANVSEYVAENREHLQRIITKQQSSIHIFPVENIRYIEAQDDYVMFYTTEGKYLKKQRMKYLEDHLDPDYFVRIHRSYIANIKNIKQIELYEKDSYRVILDDKQTLPVSKTGYDKLKGLLSE